MIRGVNKLVIPVRDQQRALDFWVGTVGCELVQDAPYGEHRWLEVRLPDGPVLVLDHRPAHHPDGPEGVPNSSVFLYADDVDATWRELAGRGVAFLTEPREMPFGKWALFEDSEGNTFALTERS